MRPRRKRWLYRDLSAGAAFSSMAVSGEVPPWAIALFAGAFCLALMNRRILRRGAGWSALGLLAAALALYGATGLGRLDLVVASCTFAGMITAHRMLSEPSTATDNQVHLTSLLMLAGGAALSGEMLFAVCLFAFALFGTLALGLGVLDQDEIAAPRAAVRQLAWGAVAAMIGSGVFFALFPRLSWNFAARRAARGLGAPVTGFTDRVELGGSGGAIKTSSRIVARVRLSPDPQKDRLDAYWPGRAFDTFDGRGWKGSGRQHHSRSQVTLRGLGERMVHQEFELTPAYGTPTLVALDRPALFSNASVEGAGGWSRTDLVEVEAQEVHFALLGSAYLYQANSVPAEAQDMPAATSLRDRLSQLPGTLSPRVREFAQAIGGEGRPLEIARRLEGHLRTQFAYTLDLGPPTADPLTSFLFERRAGHCEYFATALAVLLRERGIPARIVSGFYGGERIADQYVLRAGDAHVWTEALIDGHFVHLDATPEAARPSQTSAIFAWLSSVYDSVDSAWRSRVVDYSLRDQVELANRLVRPPKSVGFPAAPRWGPAAPWAAGLGAAALAGWALWRRRKSPSSQAQRLRVAIERWGPPVLSTSPWLEEAIAGGPRVPHPLAPVVRAAADRYLSARFGGRPLSPQERRALTGALKRAARISRRT